MNMEQTIEAILELEWEAFRAVHNEGGRAPCQEDEAAFKSMRAPQFLTWGEEIRDSYLTDLREAKARGRNLPEEKYARMMESTHPDRYREIESRLPAVSARMRELAEEIVAAHLVWKEEFNRRYPGLASRSRPLRAAMDTPEETSVETYLRAELLSYSERTLERYVEHVRKMRALGISMAFLEMGHVARQHGYGSIEAAEAQVRHDSQSDSKRKK